jgi:hypothetical protein
MRRRLRRTAAALLVVCAGLFIVGVTVEADTHVETNEPARDHDEASEAAGSESGHDEAAEAAGSDADHHESGEEEQVLGVDVESPGAVGLAVAASIALAVGLWIRKQRWLAIAAVGVAVVFAVFDVAEFAHQISESRTGLALLATVIAAGHLAASATAALSTTRTA